jgi:hypothetical protein
MNKENKMNKKMIAVVMLVVVGTLVVSAFSWPPNHDAKHEGLKIYHQSERANYAEISALGFNQLKDVESARWMGAALASQAQATNPQIRNIESARWMGAALASQATEHQFSNVESARWMGAALASQVQVKTFPYTSLGR